MSAGNPLNIPDPNRLTQIKKVSSNLWMSLSYWMANIFCSPLMSFHALFVVENSQIKFISTNSNETARISLKFTCTKFRFQCGNLMLFFWLNFVVLLFKLDIVNANLNPENGENSLFRARNQISWMFKKLLNNKLTFYQGKHL